MNATVFDPGHPSGRQSETLPEISPATPAAPLPVHPRTLMQAFAGTEGRRYLLYGEEPVFSFAMLLLAQAAHRGLPVAVIDGCNRLNVHALVRYARQQRIDPDRLLDRIHVSRGFTCYQMEAAIGRLPLFLRSHGARTAIVLGLLDTFYDEQAPFREVDAMLRRIIGELRAMKDEGTALLLCNFEWNVLPRERNIFLRRLKEGVDSVYRLTAEGYSSSRLFLEHQATDHQQHKEQGTMGRTVQTFTGLIESEMSSWKKFRRGLRKEDQDVFDDIFRAAKRHLAENFYAMRTIPFESIIMSIVIEQGKLIRELQRQTGTDGDERQRNNHRVAV